MKIYISTILLFWSLLMPNAMHAVTKDKSLIIDSQDTVFFDMHNQIINGSTIWIPVYFRSDDMINAVDFEFKYDQSKLQYDTILMSASYLDGLSYYNQNDSTVRLTSYSFAQPISNDTVLFHIQFTLLIGSQVCSGDMNSLAALLNGDACSEFVSDCQAIGIDENPISNQIYFYPNPVSDILYYSGEERFDCRILDLEGKELVVFRPDERLNIRPLPSGAYIVQLFKGRSSRSFRILKR